MISKPSIRAVVFNIPKITPITVLKKNGLLNQSQEFFEKQKDFGFETPYLEVHKTMYLQNECSNEESKCLELIPVTTYPFHTFQSLSEKVDLSIIELGDCIELSFGETLSKGLFVLYIVSEVTQSSITLSELVLSHNGRTDFILGRYNQAILDMQNEVYLKHFGVNLVDYLALHKAMFSRVSA